MIALPLYRLVFFAVLRPPEIGYHNFLISMGGEGLSKGVVNKHFPRRSGKGWYSDFLKSSIILDFVLQMVSSYEDGVGPVLGFHTSIEESNSRFLIEEDQLSITMYSTLHLSSDSRRFATFSFSIGSLTVGHAEVEGLSHITTGVPGIDESIGKLVQQLYKLVNLHESFTFTAIGNKTSVEMVVVSGVEVIVASGGEESKTKKKGRSR
ncbi:hypothetical protein ACS0TY_030377 [Phlomoides rotata]